VDVDPLTNQGEERRECFIECHARIIVRLLALAQIAAA
jgi:hypothetical protein